MLFPNCSDMLDNLLAPLFPGSLWLVLIRTGSSLAWRAAAILGSSGCLCSSCIGSLVSWILCVYQLGDLSIK